MNCVCSDHSFHRLNREISKMRENNKEEKVAYSTMVENMKNNCNSVMQELEQKTEEYNSLLLTVEELYSRMRD